MAEILEHITRTARRMNKQTRNESTKFVASDPKLIETSLFKMADQLRANSGLKPSEYSRPVLGLLFLRYAEGQFASVEQTLAPKPGSRIKPGPDDYKAQGVIYLSPEARFSYLLNLPEDADVGRALNNAMKDIERDNVDLEDVLPKNFNEIPKDTLIELIRLLQPLEIDGDAFGHVYEYFMGEFAKQEMQKGGEFYTPSSIVRLIVEIIEPFHGRILDPACGSAGMFVHSADFVKRHQRAPDKEISLFGMEKTKETIRLAKMNLAVHGLSGTIADTNSYYDDAPEAFKGVPLVDGFDFVMANPPFNVSGVDKAKLKTVTASGTEVVKPRFPFGLPSTDNGNYIWISQFHSALNENGRAGFVMANSAADARGSEAEIRRKLIESGVVDVIVSVGPNFFLTVTLPCTLWFFDRAKPHTNRTNEVLFIDARHIFNQVDRAHRDFRDDQIEFLANIVRLWRGNEPELAFGSEALLRERLGGLDAYRDVPGLCRAASRKEIEAQGWSLNPGRYVGVAEGEADDEDFLEKLEALQEELERLNVEAVEFQGRIALNVAELLA
ncbi:type I restriction-modification system subunit M [Sphingobium sufflavum]|uniref:type I restriction-modification system subunit M n=1 Tax=Sphingobium sufflavum TaxID=1129547 RepID=UPI001F34FD5E|nr:class I SAM-dependent DNA methyltransferase [Sphingobium sufflavum]MCE7796524.1 type I restriction-modification system subunit M [Sphingobium sufflavum]